MVFLAADPALGFVFLLDCCGIILLLELILENCLGAGLGVGLGAGFGAAFGAGLAAGPGTNIGAGLGAGLPTSSVTALKSSFLKSSCLDGDFTCGIKGCVFTDKLPSVLSSPTEYSMLKGERS